MPKHKEKAPVLDWLVVLTKAGETPIAIGPFASADDCEAWALYVPPSICPLENADTIDFVQISKPLMRLET